MSLEHSFRKVEDRSRFNHLFSSPFDDACLYFINVNYELVQLRACDDEYKMDILFSAEVPIGNFEEREYPSVAFPAPDTFIFSDGTGTLIILQRSEDASFYPRNSLRILPFLLTDACINSENGKFYCLGYSTKAQENETAKSKIQFNMKCIEIDLNDTSMISSYKVVMESMSPTGPLYTFLQQDGTAFIIGSEFPNEIYCNLPHIKTEGILPGSKHVKYNWTQTEEDVTIYVQIDSSIDKRFINGRFTPKYIHLSLLSPSDIPLFNSDNQLFDDIIPTESIWTLEGEGKLITLYLQKKNPPFRWTNLFKNDESVPETLDPETLADYNAKLEKFSGEEEFELPSHANTVTEKAEDIDFEGQGITFTRVSMEKGYQEISHCNFASGHEWMCGGPKSSLSAQVCLGYDVDGLVYTISDPLQMTHTSTFSAMNFIKNSKREKQFTYYLNNMAYCLIIEMRRYVYIYRREGDGATQSEQMMVDLLELDASTGKQESIIGVQQISDDLIVLLRNSSLVIIRI